LLLGVVIAVFAAEGTHIATGLSAAATAGTTPHATPTTTIVPSLRVIPPPSL
jgi:hypothetical protein